ncbi:hypothetical protein EMIHUDRAFT_469832 [Emiliania huxleyi CCMP1516]|uniref:CNNM transmembrane domain-containing protein n=4 Tax=Emiliania huxleyi TaxID=2903 RepID=A0A0D3JCU0_EMIH1|nr:hypothetical protein EMIHUDRAFT_469832 [Emiliania huxleyi CCMP1516]EOD21325.1 hypothetical protein EMIHUDRAFT_469832 [Emiliania huxleyi CCMP1516]|eukprot:XP_005773754.1 hypothetical protein EMIHUDRAFT_469832 [Emiliania huxleyi CCMP1516]
MSPFLSGCLDTLHEGGVGLDSATALCSKLAALKASPLESLEEEPSHFASFDKPEDWMNLSVALCCMLMAATASGLTMGVVSLDELELRVKERNVNESKTERGYATRILPLIRLSPRHQLLVSLLLLNAIANEAMPLFLDKLVPPWAAILISVTAVLFVGEIIPAAALDRLLPHAEGLPTRHEVKALVDAMDLATMKQVIALGHSRVPVYWGPAKSSITRFIHVKDQIMLTPADATPVGPEDSLFALLNTFQEGAPRELLSPFQPLPGRPALASQGEFPGGKSGCIGVITLEDIIEEILTEERGLRDYPRLPEIARDEILTEERVLREIYDESDIRAAKQVLNKFVLTIVRPRLEKKRAGAAAVAASDSSIPPNSPLRRPPPSASTSPSFGIQCSLVAGHRSSPRRLPSVERLVLRSSFTEASVDGKRRVLRGTASDGRVQDTPMTWRRVGRRVLRGKTLKSELAARCNREMAERWPRDGREMGEAHSEQPGTSSAAASSGSASRDMASPLLAPSEP